MLVLTIKIKEKGFALDPVTLKPLLLPFKKVKGLNVKMPRSLFLFKIKIFKIKREKLKFNKFIFLKNIFITSSLQKCKAKKGLKDFLRKS